jgi:hypothetical protein
VSAKPKVNRRAFLGRGLAIAGASLLGGCDSELSEQPWVKRILDSAEALTASPSGRRFLPRHSPANIARPTSPRNSRRTARRIQTTINTRRMPPMDLPDRPALTLRPSPAKTVNRLPDRAPSRFFPA